MAINLDDPRFNDTIHTVYGPMRWYLDACRSMRLRSEPHGYGMHIASVHDYGSINIYNSPESADPFKTGDNLTTDEAFRFITDTLRDNNLLAEDTPAMDNPAPTTTIRYEPSPPDSEPLPYIKDLPPLTVFGWRGEDYIKAAENWYAINLSDGRLVSITDHERPDAILPCTITINTEKE